jgi:hypothetical protein
MDRIKKEFSFLKNILGVLVYGSYASKQTTPRSDIDICIVLGKPVTVKQMTATLRKVWRNVNTKKYDIKLFEELPLHIKIQVIEKGKVIIGNKPAIYEYFYKFRKMWDSQKHRQKL